MASKRYIQYQRNKALVAYSMHQNGYTTNEIAVALGITPKQVKSTVERGERLNSLKEE